MIFLPTPLPGVWRVELEPLEDERGLFARSWCRQAFLERGLSGDLVQCNLSWNRKRGTLRGLHWQEAPHGEIKLVRCIRGSIWDVVVDLRRDSPCYGRWHAVELDAGSRRGLYIPEGLAHGFQTLSDDTEVFYQMSTSYVPEAARGIRWNDPAFGIAWPLPNEVILSERDASFPDYR
ncbi:MAG: dTDP-4-dehydrorhamnose 3,5-epimerase [Magnetococcales bacterium]|nr:dTDP-4-dehydrorhamnose 3,5-epimerase [Magnetococcales bacterium]